jgi:hypothetical protein
MRLLRVLLVALFGIFAVIAGLITAAAVSAVTAFVLVLKRTLAPSRGARLPPREPQRFSRPNAGEIIDVTATEVPADSAHR